MDDYVEDEFDFQEEYGAFKRSGYLERDILAEVGIDVGRRKASAIRDPTERFYVYVNSVARFLSSNDVAGLTYADVQIILTNIKSTPNARYKNPTAYVLGYGVTKGIDADIDARKLVKIETDIRRLELPVRLEDVIRYATLWLNLRRVRTV